MKVICIVDIKAFYSNQRNSINCSNIPCHFAPLAKIPGSTELVEYSFKFEEVQWSKIIRCQVIVRADSFDIRL